MSWINDIKNRLALDDSKQTRAEIERLVKALELTLGTLKAYAPLEYKLENNTSFIKEAHWITRLIERIELDEL